MSSVRLFDQVGLPSTLIDKRLKPVDITERALFDARLNVALSDKFKAIDCSFKTLKYQWSSCGDGVTETAKNYGYLVRAFKVDVLNHSTVSPLDSNILDLIIAANNMRTDIKDEQALQDVMQKKAELEKAVEYAIQQRKLCLVNEAYNEWKYPLAQSTDFRCTIL